MSEFVTVAEHREFAARIDAEDKRQNARIDRLEETVEKINNLTVEMTKMTSNMETMASSTKKLAEELVNQGKKLEAIEQEPADNWKKVTWEIIKYAVILALGIVAMKIGAAV